MHCVIYVQHSREAGMDAHISKPFDVKTLCTVSYTHLTLPTSQQV